MIKSSAARTAVVAAIAFLLFVGLGSLLTGQQTVNGIPNQTVTGTVSNAAGTNGQIQYNNGGTALGGVTLVPLANGGTNAAITANNGGLIYSTGSALAILNGTATANQIPLSGSSTTPAWSTATYPGTTTVNQLLWSNSANAIGGLTTANNGVLITSGGGVPSISSTIPTATQANITQLGSLTTAVITTKTVTGGVNTVSSGATPAFDLSLGNTQYMAALAVSASPTVSNISAGAIYTFIVCENGTGGFTWTWPAAIHGGMTISTTASKCNAQDFRSADGTTLYATTAGIIQQ